MKPLTRYTVFILESQPLSYQEANGRPVQSGDHCGATPTTVGRNQTDPGDPGALVDLDEQPVLMQLCRLL